MELAKLRTRIYELESRETKKIEKHLDNLELKLGDVTKAINGSECRVTELKKKI